MRAVSIGLLLLAFLAGGIAEPAPARQPEFIPGQYIVLLKDGPGDPRAAAAGPAAAREPGVRVKTVYQAALRGFSCSATAAAARRLATRADVAAVIPDLVVRASAQILPTGINRVDADALTSPVRIDGADDAPDIDIAIIDTGVGPHADLLIAGGADFTGSGSFLDGNGHGTHVAGIAAARDDGDGVVGICPGARIWAVRVLGPDGSGALSQVAAGVDWVADTTKHPPIEVANLSLGAYYPAFYELLYGDPLKTAVLNASARGVHIAVAAGNESQNAVDYIPARYDPVVCTSALADSDGLPGGLGAPTSRGPDDSLANFSNWGAVVDAIAPGVGIYSTLPGDQFATFNGTSLASPHTAGAIAVYLLANPGATPAQVLAVFQSGGEAGPPGGRAGDPDGTAERAVNLPLLLGAVAPPPPPPPPAADFTVAVSTSRPSYRRGQLIMITVRATKTAGGGVSGAPVVLTVTNPRGAAQTGRSTTGTGGATTFLAFTNSRDPLGTWTLRAQVTSGGLTREGTGSFQVTQ